MYLKIPSKFAKDVLVQKHIRKVNFVETIVFWFVDGTFRKSVNLQKW